MKSCKSTLNFPRPPRSYEHIYERTHFSTTNAMTKAKLAILRATIYSRCIYIRPRQFLRHSFRHASTKPAAPNPRDDFVSIVDAPARLISTKRKNTSWGIALLAVIPLTAFILGSWQVQRLTWKTDLIAKFEDRLVRPPLPLPPRIDPTAISEFDYRRVYATGILRHDREMLIGPRMHDSVDGFLVVTPLERQSGETTILINRGWISREKQYQQDRDPNSLPKGTVTVSGLLREPWKKNFFTPNNRPEAGKFYFPDVYQMAKVSGSEPVWIEETMEPNLLETYNRQDKGTPIGRAAEVNLRNNHTQYIFTW
jgi:surfeit locus 1 family protein